MNFSFTFGIFEFFFEDDRDYIPLDGDSLIGIRISDLRNLQFIPKQENKLTDFIAFFCGGKKWHWTNGYYFYSHRAGQHFINLTEGFNSNNPYLGDEEDTAPPPWTKKDELDDDDLLVKEMVENGTDIIKDKIFRAVTGKTANILASAVCRSVN